MTMFYLDIRPFYIAVDTDFPLVIDNAMKMYGDRLSVRRNPNLLVDYSIDLTHAGGLRRWWRPQVRFLCDHREPFKPLHANQAFAMMEWGINWTIAAHEVQYVIVHAAVLAKGDKAVVFPAPPGSGKSTLTAHLAMNGWRLLSDEMALMLPNSTEVLPFVRPICLKNQSIPLAQKWFPEAAFSTIARHTHKGDVIHLAPTSSAWQSSELSANVVAVVFPNYRADTFLDIYAMNQAEGLEKFAENAFNFSVLGKKGFDTLCHVASHSTFFDIYYNNLSEVQAFLEEEVIQ